MQFSAQRFAYIYGSRSADSVWLMKETASEIHGRSSRLKDRSCCTYFNRQILQGLYLVCLAWRLSDEEVDSSVFCSSEEVLYSVFISESFFVRLMAVSGRLHWCEAPVRARAVIL